MKEMSNETMPKKELIPVGTIIGEMNGKYKGKIQTFIVFYGNACLPVENEGAKFVHLPQESYNNILRKFLMTEEGRNYEIPSTTKVLDDAAKTLENNRQGLYDAHVKEIYMMLKQMNPENNSVDTTSEVQNDAPKQSDEKAQEPAQEVEHKENVQEEVKKEEENVNDELPKEESESKTEPEIQNKEPLEDKVEDDGYEPIKEEVTAKEPEIENNEELAKENETPQEEATEKPTPVSEEPIKEAEAPKKNLNDVLSKDTNEATKKVQDVMKSEKSDSISIGGFEFYDPSIYELNLDKLDEEEKPTKEEVKQEPVEVKQEVVDKPKEEPIKEEKPRFDSWDIETQRKTLDLSEIREEKEDVLIKEFRVILNELVDKNVKLNNRIDTFMQRENERFYVPSEIEPVDDNYTEIVELIKNEITKINERIDKLTKASKVNKTVNIIMILILIISVLLNYGFASGLFVGVF